MDLQETLYSSVQLCNCVHKRLHYDYCMGNSASRRGPDRIARQCSSRIQLNGDDDLLANGINVGAPSAEVAVVDKAAVGSCDTEIDAGCASPQHMHVDAPGEGGGLSPPLSTRPPVATVVSPLHPQERPSPLFQNNTQRTRHGVRLSAHDDFEKSVARIELFFHPRFYARIFFVGLVRQVAWPLFFIITQLQRLRGLTVGTAVSSSSGARFSTGMQFELGLLRLLVYVCMGFSAAEWQQGCRGEDFFQYCRDSSVAALDCHTSTTTVFMPFALCVLRAMYRSALEALFKPVVQESSRKLQGKRRLQSTKNFRKHQQIDYHKAAKRSRQQRKKSSIDGEFQLSTPVSPADESATPRAPMYIVVLEEKERQSGVTQQQHTLSLEDVGTPKFKATWASFCATCDDDNDHQKDKDDFCQKKGADPRCAVWLMAPPPPGNAKFEKGTLLLLGGSDSERAMRKEAKKDLTKADLQLANDLLLGDEDDEGHSNRFRKDFISRSVYQVEPPKQQQRPKQWRCKVKIDRTYVKSSDITIDMLLSHQLKANDEATGITLRELPVSEYVQSPRYVYCHAIASVADESELKKRFRQIIAPLLGLIHGLILLHYVQEDTRYAGAGPGPLLASSPCV